VINFLAIRYFEWVTGEGFKPGKSHPVLRPASLKVAKLKISARSRAANPQRFALSSWRCGRMLQN
jgi:hypothetical protein